MGGGTDVDAAYIWMIERAGGGDFLILRATGNGAYDDYIYDLGQQTSQPVNSVSTLVLKTRAASFDSFVIEMTQNCSALYFAGGDQWTYYSFWKSSPLQKAIIKSPHYAARPTGGTSAGNAIQPEFVYNAEFGSADSVTSLRDPYNEYITIGTSFLANQVLTNTITDTHFYQRNRMGRLVAFISRLATDSWAGMPNAPNSGCSDPLYGARAIGVDEATALLIDENNSVSITSWDVDGSAYLLCLDHLPTSCAPKTHLDVADIQTIKLSGNGTDLFNLHSWSVINTNVVQYTLTASNGVLDSSQSGGDIY